MSNPFDQFDEQNVNPFDQFGPIAPGSDLAYNKPNEPTNPSFLQRIGSDLNERSKIAYGIRDAYRSGQQTLPESFLQLAGKVGAGATADMAGETVMAGLQGLRSLLPEPVDNALNKFGSELATSPVGQFTGRTLQSLGQGYGEFQQEHPRAARNLEATANIALMASPGKVKPNQKGVAATTGRFLERSADKLADKRTTKFVEKLLLPKQTPAVRLEQVGRTIQTPILRRNIVQPTPQMKEAIDIVKTLPVKKGRSLQYNYNVIDKAIGDEAEVLKSTLKNNNVFFPRHEFDAQLNNAIKTLAQSPVLVGDAEKAAQKIIEKAREIVQKKPSSAAGLLEARKELDQWVKSQKGGTVFDPVRDNAFSIALREIRGGINSFIDAKVPVAGVKQSLRKQSNLYNALDYIGPKAAEEAQNVTGRFGQKVIKSLPLKTEEGKLLSTAAGATAAGATLGLGDMAMLAGGGLGLYGLGKALTGVTPRRITGKALQSLNNTGALNYAEKLGNRAFLYNLAKENIEEKDRGR